MPHFGLGASMTAPRDTSGEAPDAFGWRIFARSLAATLPVLEQLAGDPSSLIAPPGETPPTARQIEHAAAILGRIAMCLHRAGISG